MSLVGKKLNLLSQANLEEQNLSPQQISPDDILRYVLKFI